VLHDGFDQYFRRAENLIIGHSDHCPAERLKRLLSKSTK